MQPSALKLMVAGVLAGSLAVAHPHLLAQASNWDEQGWESDEWDEWQEDETPSPWSGFVEAALGTRIDSDPLLPQRGTLQDARWRIEREWRPGEWSVSAKADLGYDGIEDDLIADFRELNLARSLGSSTDLKLGRQVQTWGVGDLLFLNDLFPKDFVSFFAGRDDEYLKAPGDSLRLTHYAEGLNVDFVWTPVFEPDVYLTGERFSFFSPLAGGNIAPDPPLRGLEPDRDLENGEFAARFFKTIGSNELALYVYRGFFKQPNALTDDLQATFAPLSAYGASLRRPLGKGLLSAEFSWYDSRDDRSGDDPLTPNSQLRYLLGYEWEAARNFTVGLQYYLEQTLDHAALERNSQFPEFEPDEFRHLLTNRLSWRLARERYVLSLFTFWSPSDQDFYLRPAFTYRHDDHWQFTTGANLFGGNEAHTFFKQLQDASNVYLRFRFSY